jgi:RNA exonuclease 4
LDDQVLMLSHPKKHMRDTHSYKPLCNKVGRPRALRHLAALHLGCQIQEGEHNSVEDARAAMFLYQRFKEEWEQNLRHRVNPAYVNTLGTLQSQKASR